MVARVPEDIAYGRVTEFDLEKVKKTGKAKKAKATPEIVKKEDKHVTSLNAKDADNKRRKIYLCGRCGVPKRGHVCPIPSDDEAEEEEEEELETSVPVLQVP